LYTLPKAPSPSKSPNSNLTKQTQIYIKYTPHTVFIRKYNKPKPKISNKEYATEFKLYSMGNKMWPKSMQFITALLLNSINKSSDVNSLLYAIILFKILPLYLAGIMTDRRLGHYIMVVIAKPMSHTSSVIYNSMPRQTRGTLNILGAVTSFTFSKRVFP